jgi:hypothetical protein
MMERHYKPTGWLGLLLGTRLYFSFDDDAVATHEAFMQQIDLVERELGERGKVEATAAAAAAAAAAVRLAPEGVPPPTLRSMEPTPEPAPAPAPVPAPRPRAAASSSATMTLSTPERTTSFTPSMRQQQPQQQQISAASPTMQAITHQCGVADGSLLVETLQAQVKAHQAEASELRLEMERLRAEAAEAKLQALELRLTPTAAISEQRLAALQARLEALHKADLLGDDQLYMLEDVVADFVEFESAMGGAAVTLEAVHANENARNLLKLVKLVGLSERIASDDAFSRQVKRKCV